MTVLCFLFLIALGALEVFGAVSNEPRKRLEKTAGVRLTMLGLAVMFVLCAVEVQ